MWAMILLIIYLEASEPPSELCTSPYSKPIPEMCDAKFNRTPEWFE